MKENKGNKEQQKKDMILLLMKRTRHSFLIPYTTLHTISYGLDNTRLFMSLTAGAGTRCMSLLSSSPSLISCLLLVFLFVCYSYISYIWPIINGLHISVYHLHLSYLLYLLYMTYYILYNPIIYCITLLYHSLLVVYHLLLRVYIYQSITYYITVYWLSISRVLSYLLSVTRLSLCLLLV